MPSLTMHRPARHRAVERGDRQLYSDPVGAIKDRSGHLERASRPNDQYDFDSLHIGAKERAIGRTGTSLTALSGDTCWSEGHARFSVGNVLHIFMAVPTPERGRSPRINHRRLDQTQCRTASLALMASLKGLRLGQQRKSAATAKRQWMADTLRTRLVARPARHDRV